LRRFSWCIPNLDVYAGEIKRSVGQYCGLPVGIGVAKTKTLAKLANKIGKARILMNCYFKGFCMSLYDANGQRLYLTESERNAFLEAAAQSERTTRTLCLLMAYTGCRISEALALQHKSIDFADKTIRSQ